MFSRENLHFMSLRRYPPRPLVMLWSILCNIYCNTLFYRNIVGRHIASYDHHFDILGRTLKFSFPLSEVPVLKGVSGKYKCDLQVIVIFCTSRTFTCLPRAGVELRNRGLYLALNICKVVDFCNLWNNMLFIQGNFLLQYVYMYILWLSQPLGWPGGWMGWRSVMALKLRIL